MGFRPGENGGQKGGRRPGAGRKPCEVKPLRERLVKGGDAAYEELVRLMTNSKSDKVRLDAAKALLEHSVGRPKQAIDLEVKETPETQEKHMVRLFIEAGRAGEIPPALQHLIPEVERELEG